MQRLQAEYVNYKRRVDRDRDLARKVTIEGVLKDFLSVLDDVRSAREHEELSGGFKAVAEEIQRVTSKYGLETFGKAGDPFNPHIHEALLHAHAEGIDGPTCVEILQPGYRIEIASCGRRGSQWPSPSPEALTPSRYAVSPSTSSGQRLSKGPRQALQVSRVQTSRMPTLSSRDLLSSSAEKNCLWNIHPTWVVDHREGRRR